MSDVGREREIQYVESRVDLDAPAKRKKLRHTHTLPPFSPAAVHNVPGSLLDRLIAYLKESY